MNSDIVILSDRIKELSHTKGQGAFVLDGELAGFSRFGDFYQYGDVVYYAATDGTYYEVGSGEYRQNGSDNELTRFPLRSSALDSGPYYLNGDSASGPTEGQQGYFYPLYLTKSAAMAVAGATSAHTHTFSGYHGVTFYMPNNHNGHAMPGALSGVDYVASGQPFNFPDFGIKEVYVTYPGKYSVFTGYGISGYREPQTSGVAFWGSEQLVNYDSNMLWSDARSNLGISQTNPQFAIDVGGDRAYSQVRASGFFGGGSGVYFSGGQALPQDATKTASGGRQLEPFFRNELDNTTGTDAIFFLSGIVNERICSLQQEKGTVYAGPASGCEDVGCSPDYPTFRFLTLEDIPDLSSLYVVQDRSMDEDPSSLTQNGAVALYKESGVITYDDAFVFKKDTNRVGIGTNSPSFSLDIAAVEGVGVSGNVIVSGDIYTTYNSNVHSSGGVFARTDSYFGNDVTISGDLFVKGTTTYIDSTTVTIQDKQLELASTSGYDSYASSDALVDDGGIVVRSSGNGLVNTGDKKWTWRTATNTWNAQTSNGENLGITSSGIIFNAGMGTVSGAYLAGSGLTLLNNNLTFAIGDMFKVGAVDSGNAGSDGNYVTNFVHQADEVGFSGTLGVAVNSSGFHADSGIRIMIDPSGLSGVLSNAFLVSDGSSAPDLIGNKHTVFWSGGQGIDVEYNGFTNSGLFDIDASGLSGTLSYAIANAAGGYAGWSLTDGTVAADTITSASTVTISGASGITTNYNATSNTLELSPHPLSGVLQGKIDAVSGMVVDSGILVSGFALNYTNASGNFLLDTINASGMNISGVLGYTLNNLTTSNIAAATLVTSSEGVGSNDNDTTIPTTAAVKAYADSLGGLGGSYAGFKLGADGYDQDTIGSAELVTISGVSGVQTRYVPGSNTLLIDAVALSGNLQYNINASGAAVSGLANTASVAVSGFAKGHDTVTSGTLQGGINAASGWATATDLYTSGTLQAGINAVSGHSVYAASLGGGGSTLSAGSGLTKVGTTLHMDINGSGQLKHLIFPDGSGIRIGFNAGAGQVANNNHYHSVFIGSNAGGGSSYDIGDSVAIGSGAGYGAQTLTSSTLIGTDAGSGIAESRYDTFVGYKTAIQASGTSRNFGFGQKAAFGASGINRTHFMGEDAIHGAYNLLEVFAVGQMAGSGAIESNRTQMIGYRAGMASSGCDSSVFLGDDAGAQTSGIQYGIYIGSNAGRYCVQEADNTHASIGIGTLALQKASGNANIGIGYHAGLDMNTATGIAIGHDTGEGASGLRYNIMMGNSAGYLASGRYSAAQPFANDAIFIGHRAGYKSFDKANPISIGTDAGRDTHQNSQVISMGIQAGWHSSGVSNSINIGYTAGQLTHPANINDTSIYQINIGDGAGSHSVGGRENVSIDLSAGSRRYEGVNGVNVGNTKNIMIGRNAGSYGQGSENIFIGRYVGASGNTGSFNGNYKKCLFIIPGIQTEQDSAGLTSWVNQTPGNEDEKSIQIGEVIYGTPNSIRIGEAPTSVSDFSSNTLQLAPDTSTRVNLKTEMYSSSDTGDQIQASTDTNGHANTIVNSKGWLQLPIALNKTGSGSANINFYTHASDVNHKYLIPRTDGVVAMYKQGSVWRLIFFSATDNRWYSEGTGTSFS